MARPATIPLKQLIFRYRTGILLAPGLVVIENVAWILEPTMFGDVLGAFVDKSPAATSAGFLLPLCIWIGVFLVNSGAGALRRIFDPRIYLRI